jgi:hypothetical protein
MSGWQDAVAGLQTQVDAINTQISTLSGEETSEATVISSLQTQVAAIQTQITSLQQLAPFGDYSGQIAVLSNPVASQTVFSLTQGGTAAIPLSASDIDGKLIHVHSAGLMTFDPNFPSQTASYSIELGDPTNLTSGLTGLEQINIALVGQTAPYRTFATDSVFFWNSTFGKIFIFSNGAVDNFLSGASVTAFSPAPTFSVFPISQFSPGAGSVAKISVTDFRVTLL